MKKSAYLTGFLVWVFMMPGAGLAFVPQAPHLLHLVIEKIKQPVGIEISQTKTIINHSQTDPESKAVLEEALIYVFPHKLRSQVVSESQTGFSVESDFAFIKVMDNQVVSEKKSAMDVYSDILLYRDHESLLQQLDLAGVDTTKVSFQRYEETICYLIGTYFAGLWIDKETFFPVRYVIQKNDWNIEFIYSNWQKRSRTWYPMSVQIFMDNQLLANIDVHSFNLKSQSSLDIFDIEQIKKMYPGKDMQGSDMNSSQVDELDKSIENFKKLYE